MEYEEITEDCKIIMNALLEKTKFSEILLLRLNNIHFESEINLNYLETDKLDLMISI